MRAVNTILEDEEYEQFKEGKGKQSWRSYLLELKERSKKLQLKEDAEHYEVETR